jgi:hypothetical protein
MLSVIVDRLWSCTNLTTRVAQGLLAITATGVSVLLLQLAMVA